VGQRRVPPRLEWKIGRCARQVAYGRRFRSPELVSSTCFFRRIFAVLPSER
jgi:hypothetical protein